MNQPAVSQQLWQIVQMALCGWLIMLTTHQKSVLAVIGRWKYRQRIAGDFLFCMCWAVMLWLVFLQVSGGLVRYYIVLGLAGGAAVYQFFCRRHLEGICKFAARRILFIWRWCLWLVKIPWKIFRRGLYCPFVKIIKKFVPTKQEFDGTEENFLKNENYFSS